MSRPAYTVLMYHAILAPDGDTVGADAHYAVSREQFTAHVQAVRARGARPTGVSSLLGHPLRHAVAFTFDDGHESNEWAADLLQQAGGSGDFFVNSATIGTSGFLSWAALRDMHRAGMSIQSHGHRHRFLDDLSPAEVRDELLRSKSMIEDRLGAPVTLFAPPGGRMPGDLHAVAAAVGYRAVCSSRAGLWRHDRQSRALPDVPRLPVLLRTSQQQLESWLDQCPVELLWQRLRYELLHSGKQLLGNGRYERLRSGLLRLAARGR